jgi:hypothetical protein
MNYNNIFWEFVRGDLSTKDFEKYVYESQSLENDLKSEYYQFIIEANFKDLNEVEDLKNKIENYLLKTHPPKCKCICVKDLDRTGFGTQFSEGLFSSLNEVKPRGEDFWWESTYRCNVCHQNWLVAQDENYDDFYLMRIDEKIVQSIENKNEWPSVFDNYDRLSTVVSSSSRFSNY